jgi:DNA-binding LytR/AlgR family response regulator
MMLLPEFIFKQPKFGQANRPFFLHKFPIPAPMFEMVNIFLLFSIVIYASIAQRSRHLLPQMDTENSPLTVNRDTPKLDIIENNTETALTVTVNYSLVRITFEDILFIKSMDNYLHFHLKAKKPILVRMTLKEVSEKLPANDFMRVHKSFIVAKSAIDSIRNKTILIGEQEIPISRAYEETVFKIMGK